HPAHAVPPQDMLVQHDANRPALFGDAPLLEDGKEHVLLLAWWHWSANCWKNRGAHGGKPSGSACPASGRATALSSRPRPRSIRSCSAFRRSTDFMTLSPVPCACAGPDQAWEPICRSSRLLMVSTALGVKE